MTSLWTVIVGDNSQGNGGSVTAPNVRFKTLNKMFLDSQGRLNILDGGFNNTRIIDKTDSRIISTSEVSKNVFKVYDSSGSLYSINKGETGSLGDVIDAKDINLIPGSLAIRRINNIESFIFSSFSNKYEPNKAEANAFIFEIPLNKIKDLITKKQKLTKSELMSFVILGNGLIPPTLCEPHDNVIVAPSLSTISLASEDCSKVDHSVGSVGTIVTTEDGDIIIGTNRDGYGYGSGHFTIKCFQR